MHNTDDYSDGWLQKDAIIFPEQYLPTWYQVPTYLPTGRVYLVWLLVLFGLWSCRISLIHHPSLHLGQDLAPCLSLICFRAAAEADACPRPRPLSPSIDHSHRSEPSTTSSPPPSSFGLNFQHFLNTRLLFLHILETSKLSRTPFALASTIIDRVAWNPPQFRSTHRSTTPASTLRLPRPLQ